jgi:DNA replication protein DnaC
MKYVKYPKIVLERARKVLNDRLIESKKISREKKDKIYIEIKELKTINKAISTLIKSSLMPDFSMDEIKKNILSLVEQKNAILKERGLPDNYLDDYFECPICKDEGFVGADICNCYLDIIRKESYKLSNLADKIKNENFGTFNLAINKDKQKLHIYNIAKKFCKNDPIIKQNLLFTGSTGTGKTFLSSCIAKEFLDNEKTVLYLTATKISNIIDDAKFNRNNTTVQDEYIFFIENCDLLIIDDLGTEFNMPYSQSQLFDILETRQLNGKNTVISTNLPLETLSQKYSPRFVSRLLGNYEILVFQGADLRF